MPDARILIMDDEARERNRIDAFLKQKGYEVTALASVPLSARRPALIVVVPVKVLLPDSRSTPALFNTASVP